MSRIKGSPKTGGRQKGTPNKTTADVRHFLQRLIDDNRQTIEKDLKRLDPKDRLLVLEKFMSYIIPKQQAVAASIDYSRLSDEQLEAVVSGLAEAIEEQ